MQEITFEKMTGMNAKGASDIYNYYVENSTATYGSETVTCEGFSAYYQLDNPITEAANIYVDKKLAGFCMFKPWNAKKEAYRHTYEYTIYLDRDYVNMGLGKEAYKYLMGKTADRDIYVIMAGICSENKGSMKLAESLGFEKVGHLKNVGEKFGRMLDLVYYEKQLKAF